jgi:hypothetical protein
VSDEIEEVIARHFQEADAERMRKAPRHTLVPPEKYARLQSSLAECEAERDRLRGVLDHLKSMASNILKMTPRNNADHGMRGVAQSFMVQLEAPSSTPARDEGLPVTEEWLRSLGGSDKGLMGLTWLLPPCEPDAAIGELCVAPMDDGWSICIVQGVPDDAETFDDHVSLTSIPLNFTQGRFLSLLKALGIPAKETR